MSITESGEVNGCLLPTNEADLIRATTNWLRLIVEPDSVTELRAIDYDFEKDFPQTRAGYFDYGHLAEMARQALDLSKRARGTYFLLNPCNRSLLARSVNRQRRAPKDESVKDVDIDRRQWLPIDVDPVRPGGISSTDGERDAAFDVAYRVRAFLAEKGWPAPILADSANGAHLLYRIDLPRDDGGLVKSVLEALAGRFDTDQAKIDRKVFNPSRIWKVYGTTPHKGDPVADRPHRPARILEIPGCTSPLDPGGARLDIVSRDQLDSLVAAHAPAVSPPASTRSNGHAGGNGRSLGGQIPVLDRARKYLAKVPAAISGQGGHNATFYAACILVIDFELSEEDAMELMREYSSRCQPPWSENELRHKVESAAAQPGERGRLRNMPTERWHQIELPQYQEHADAYEAPPPAINGKSRDVAEKVEPREGVEALRITNCTQLLSTYPERRPGVIHGLLRIGETMNIIASPKTGKSWLVLVLALSVALGRLWLGMFGCTKGRVLIIDNELHPETLAHRLRTLAEAHGLSAPDLANIDVLSLRGQLRDLNGLGDMLLSIPRGTYALVIIDAWYRTLPINSDENDNGTMASLYNLLDKIGDAMDSAFALIHHSTKGSQAEKAITDIGAGAGAQSRAADTHLVLRPHEEENVVVLDAVTRSWPPVEPMCIKWEFPIWTPVADLDPAALRQTKTRKRKPEDGEPKKEKEPPWTARRFADEFGKRTPRVRDVVLEEARQKGLSDARAKSLLNAALGCGYLFDWKEGGANSRTLIATERLLGGLASENTEPTVTKKPAKRKRNQK